MKDTYNNHVTDFRYHVMFALDANSLREYLRGVYEETDFSNVRCLSDCMASQFDELEINWPVRVYDNHMSRRFSDDIYVSKWTRAAREEYTQELRLMSNFEFAIYCDSRDELNECVNSIAEHCTRHGINGSVSDIVLHVRPIEYGARDF